MATVFAGLRSTADFATDERPKDFRSAILMLEPNGKAPLLALASMLKNEKTTDPEFAWWEEESYVPRCLTTGALSTTSTAVVLQAAGTTGTKGDGLSFVPGDILQVQKALASGVNTNELVEVVTVTDATNITIRRGVAGSTAANIPTASAFLKVGNAFAEGVGAPNVSSRNPVKKYNFTQIFRTAYQETETTLATTFRTGDPLKNDRNRKMFDHGASIEHATLFGRRFEQLSGTANGKPRRYMGGFADPDIGLRQLVFATTPTEDAFLDALEPLFSRTTSGISDERITLCGNGFLNAFNKKIKNSSSPRFQFEGTLKIFGMELFLFVTPFGRVAFKTHPLLTADPIYTNSAFCISPQLYRYRDLRATKPKNNIQGNDEDSQKGEWLTETGLEIRFPELMRHFHITDATQ